MTRLFLLPIMVFFTIQGFAQMDSSLCASFKTGIFAYRDDSSNAIRIRRTAKLQEETTVKSGIVTRFKIRWLDNCSYEIKQVWSNSKSKRKNNGASTVVLITKIGKDEYDFSCNCKGLTDKPKFNGTVYRVSP